MEVGETEPTPAAIHSMSAPRWLSSEGSFVEGVGILTTYWTVPSELTFGSCFLDNLVLTAVNKWIPWSLVIATSCTTSSTTFGDVTCPSIAKTARAACRIRFFLSNAAYVTWVTHVVVSKQVLGKVIKAYITICSAFSRNYKNKITFVIVCKWMEIERKCIWVILTLELFACRNSSEVNFKTITAGGSLCIRALETLLLPGPPCLHSPVSIWTVRSSRLSKGRRETRFVITLRLSSATSMCLSEDKRVRRRVSKHGWILRRLSDCLRASSKEQIAFPRRRQSWGRKGFLIRLFFTLHNKLHSCLVVFHK